VYGKSDADECENQHEQTQVMDGINDLSRAHLVYPLLPKVRISTIALLTWMSTIILVLFLVSNGVAS
jgi:hypothetical protein